MCSAKRRSANRRNGQKSTGPVSELGKAVCSQNAMKHGLSARMPVVLDEDPLEFTAHAKEIREEFHPATPMEIVLVDRIIEQSWKIRRVPDAEREAFARAQSVLRESDDEYRDDFDNERPMSPGKVIAGAIDSEDATIERVQGYEQRIERSIHASIRALRQMRKDVASQVPVNPQLAEMQNRAIESEIGAETFNRGAGTAIASQATQLNEALAT